MNQMDYAGLVPVNDQSLHNKTILIVTDYFVLDKLEECFLVF